MLDLGWAELALIAVIGIIVIGPRELPRALKTLGYWSGKARRVMRDFQSSINDMAEESELNEVRKQIESASSVNLRKQVEKSIDPDGSLAAVTNPLNRPSSLTSATNNTSRKAIGGATNGASQTRTPSAGDSASETVSTPDSEEATRQPSAEP